MTKTTHRALLKAKRNGLNVSSAFKTKYAGPFEAKDKDGNVIPAMLSPESVNEETLEVKPQFDPDAAGASVVDANGKTLFVSDNITAKFVKMMLNKQTQTVRAKGMQEGLVVSNYAAPACEVHYDDFFVVAVPATVKCKNEVTRTQLYIGEWDNGSSRPRIVLSAMQGFKTMTLQDAQQYCNSIRKYAEECKAANDINFKRPIKLNGMIIEVDFANAVVNPITAQWRALSIVLPGTKPTKSPRKKDVAVAEELEATAGMDDAGEGEGNVPDAGDAAPEE